MSMCLTDGQLREYLDGEFPAAGAHLLECGECRGRCETVRECGVFVMDSIRSLGHVDAPVIVMRRRFDWRFATAGVLAAGLAAWFVLLPKSQPKIEHVVVSKPPVVNPPAVVAPVKTVVKRAKKKIAMPDEDSFETAVVMRVALGPDEVLADVLVTPDGRIHALCLVTEEGEGQE